ncbi:MAG TPA: AAA family ATPase [Solirubrobacteraceae bacterium]|nr:AAA family ATPase [Solirubrobacteraceae bacterium]
MARAHVSPMRTRRLVTGLLERERELAELDAVVAEVVAGKGCLVAIEAKAGLGKTRLLQVAREVGRQAGLHVLAARATELERDFPFALVRQLLEPQLTALSAPQRDGLFEGASAARGALGLETSGEPERDTFAVLHGLYWLTAALAERAPLLLAIDDAHWSDAASLDYLGFLLPRLEELPVLVVVTSRPDELNPPDLLGGIVTDSLARRLTPAALSREAAAELLTTELGRAPDAAFAAACHEVSGGNPFLLCELARTLVAQDVQPGVEQAERVRELTPERVARTVLMRVTRLGSAAGAVARALVVLGDDSDHRLVAELAGLDSEATVRGADALRAAAIFDPGPSLRFIHPLIRNAVYGDLPAGERGSTHARAAALLRARAASPERIATQLVASEPQGEREAAETLLEAGMRALATGAPRSAVVYLTRALREPPPAELRAAVLSPLITAGTRAADYSVLAAIEADVFAELERNPSLRSRWAIKLTLWMALSGRFDRAAPMLEQAIEIAVAEDDIERAFQLEAQLSTIALLTPAVTQLRLERYVDHIEPDSPSGRLMAVMQARWAAVNGTASEAAEAARWALGHNGIIFAEEPELIAPGIAVMTLVAADDVDAAQHAAKRALVIAHERGATVDLVRAWFLSGFVAWGRGDLPAAEADVRQAIELARAGGIMPAVLIYTGPLMEILIERDELDAADAELQTIGMATSPLPANAMFGLLLLVRGHLRFEQGKFEQAAEDFGVLSSQMEDMGLGPGPVVAAGPHAVRALSAVGEREQARELAESMMVYARRWGAPATVAQGLRALAPAIGGAAGVELLKEAATLLEDSPRHLLRAHALSELGAALRRENRRVDAREPLREALKLARRCGAVRLAKRTHEELLASGETVRRYTPLGVESLTPSERRVAELAAYGMTNRQIAQTLFVTVKTIEAHLSAVYDKLDIRSRRRLASALSGPSASVF